MIQKNVYRVQIHVFGLILILVKCEKKFPYELGIVNITSYGGSCKQTPSLLLVKDVCEFECNHVD